MTYVADPTRIVITNSGSFPCDSDINDVHDYEQNPEKLHEYYKNLKDGTMNDSLTRKYPADKNTTPKKHFS